MLEERLDYHDSPEDSAFVSNVMERVRRQKQIRRLILWITGFVGALFGTVGALILSKPLTQAMENINLFYVSLSLVVLVAFFVWLFADEMAATG